MRMHPDFLSIILMVIAVKMCQTCECGIENISPRIINGHESIPGQYPWIVYILNRDLMMSCTGVIISDKHILTAAHCLRPRHQDARKVHVFVNQGCGRARLFAGNQLKVRTTHRHADYNTRTGGSDIGMLVLDKPLVFNQTFMPICLLRSTRDDTYGVSSLYVTAGWGNVNKGYHIIDSDCLNEADLVHVPDFVCRLHYGTYLDTDKIMCAGGESNICNGDSGGPLMMRRNGRVYLKALTSFGRTDCGLVTKQPSGFEKIAPHLEWIIGRTVLSNLCFGDS